MTDASSSRDTTAPRFRLAWLDILRGVAILAMASYHFSWDLEFFGYLETGTVATGLFKLYARSIASSFLLLAGFSLVLSHFPLVRWRSFGIRFAKIAGAALIISIATYIAFPDGWIFFGILHSIAAASLIGLLFLRLPVAVTLIAALAAFLAPLYLRSAFFDLPALWWVGLSQMPLRSNDYVPLLPWLAPFLTGIAAGRLAVAPNWLAPHRVVTTPPGRIARALSLAGRHSLPIYLIHQPLLLSLVYLMSIASPPDRVPAYRASCVSSCIQGSDAGFCERFCGCVMDGIVSKGLFEPLDKGEIAADDNRISDIRNQCTMSAQQP